MNTAPPPTFLIIVVAFVFLFLVAIVVALIGRYYVRHCESIITAASVSGSGSFSSSCPPTSKNKNLKRKRNGVQGPIGHEGKKGRPGCDGRNGAQGTAGLTGAQGVQGVQGRVGIAGLQGLQGFQGAAGIDGQIGPQGPQGYQGIQGTTGASAILMFAGQGSLVFEEGEGTAFTLGFGSDLANAVFFPFVPIFAAQAGMIYVRIPRAGTLRNLYFSVQFVSPVFAFAPIDMVATIYVAPTGLDPFTVAPTFVTTVLTTTATIPLAGTFAANRLLLLTAAVQPGDFLCLVVSSVAIPNSALVTIEASVELV